MRLILGFSAFILSGMRREGGREGRGLMDGQRCGRCMHFRSTGGGMRLVYGSHVSSDEHYVTHRSAITGEDCGCENFVTPEADEEWYRALLRAEK